MQRTAVVTLVLALSIAAAPARGGESRPATVLLVTASKLKRAWKPFAPTSRSSSSKRASCLSTRTSSSFRQVPGGPKKQA